MSPRYVYHQEWGDIKVFTIHRETKEKRTYFATLVPSLPLGGLPWNSGLFPLELIKNINPLTPEEINAIITIHYLAHRGREYSSLLGRGCHLDLTSNSCN